MANLEKLFAFLLGFMILKTIKFSSSFAGDDEEKIIKRIWRNFQPQNCKQ